jgi:hypothetical protein
LEIVTELASVRPRLRGVLLGYFAFTIKMVELSRVELAKSPCKGDSLPATHPSLVGPERIELSPTA